MMICPRCRAELQRMQPPDAAPVAIVVRDDRAVEGIVYAAVYACPGCEYIATKTQAQREQVGPQ